MSNIITYSNNVSQTKTRSVSLEEKIAQLVTCVESVESRYNDLLKRTESVRDHVPEDISPDNKAATSIFMSPAVERINGATQRLYNIDRQLMRLIDSLQL